MKILNEMSEQVNTNVYLHSKLRKILNRKRLFITNGYIKLRLHGTSRDGIELNESFIADKFEANDESYSNSFWIIRSENDKISFNLKRCADEGQTKWIFISFYLDGDSISDENIQIGLVKKLDGNKVLDLNLFQENYEDYSYSNSITDLKFNLKTQIISGNFNFKNEKFTRINISGDFKMKLTQRLL